MSSFAGYVRTGRAPVLIRDGFSVWAFVFGPFWLLAHAAWIPALLLLAVELIVRVSLHGIALSVVGLAIAWLIGLHGQDLRGWSLQRRGWRLTYVVAAVTADTAFARLLTEQPELAPGAR